MRALSALILLAVGCLAGCTVHGRYSVQGPFGIVSWGAEGDKPHKAEIPIELLDALADRIRGDAPKTTNEEAETAEALGKRAADVPPTP